jgi:uncharacterized membrane protein
MTINIISEEENQTLPAEQHKKSLKFRDIMSQIRPFAPVLISHHPLCPRYSNHTIKIGSVNLCIGCFIGYPSAILSILFWHTIIPRLNIASKYYFLLGFILFSAQLLSFTKLTENKKIKIIQKFCIGFGAGLILTTLYYILGANMTPSLKVVMIVTISLLGTPIALLHYRTMRRTCNFCEYKWNPNYCHVDMCLADIKYVYQNDTAVNSSISQKTDDKQIDEQKDEQKIEGSF